MGCMAEREYQDNGTTIRIEEKAKHTPGPWVYCYTGTSNAEMFRIKTNARREQSGIARVFSWTDHSEESKENARLIAAAPELLEALDQLICGGCGHRIGWNGVHDAEQTRLERTDWKKCNWCKHARAAIAKATGGDR